MKMYTIDKNNFATCTDDGLVIYNSVSGDPMGAFIPKLNNALVSSNYKAMFTPDYIWNNLNDFKLKTTTNDENSIDFHNKSLEVFKTLFNKNIGKRIY